MTYVLVHLRGDQATADADRLVEHVKAARAAVATVAGESPSHRELITTLAAAPASTSGVCIGHGHAGGLGPTPSRVWANAEQLAAIFRDRRLYAYACSTTGHETSLGARAVLAGVAVYVGHEGPVEAPLPLHERRMVEAVASAAILAFIDGEDDEASLRRAIHDAGDALLGDEEPIPYAYSGRDVPNFWTQSLLFDQLAFSLRVHRRGEART